MSKIAAIWARVSSPGQTSLPDQVARAREKLSEKGYIVPQDRILMVDWTSLDLFSCPQFLQLAGWVRRKEIQGLGVLDRDRLQAEPTQRLAFLTELQGAGIELVVCQGPPMLEGDWGTLIEHVHAIAKKQQVLRAKLGAKDGMHDKVTKDRRPTSKHRVTGYRWVSDCRLQPDYPDYDTIKLIFDLALTGATYWDIQKALKGILSPNGSPEWDRSTIRGIVHNPIYAGRYYAEKHYVVEPKKRLVNSYGNSSAKTRPLEEAVYLPEVEIVNPPITWEQYLQILERRKVNQKLSSRNGKREYLLRGFIKCYTHYGKKGEPRTYYGRPNGNSYIYACPVGGCAHPNLNGLRIEERVKQETWRLLNLQQGEFYKQIGGQGNIDQTRESLKKELASLEAKYNRNINAETELENRDLLGQVHPEVYRRLKSNYQAERLWIEERKEAIEQQLDQLEKQAEIASTWWELREQYIGRLDHDLGQLSSADWRELFIALNLEIHVRDRHTPETWRDGWHPDAWQDGWYFDENRLLRGQDGVVLTNMPSGAEREEHPDVEICFGLPMKVDTEQANRVGEIVFSRACPSPSS